MNDTIDLPGNLYEAHGVFLAVNGQGWWIKGQPGSGKSRLALWLIKKKEACLIADDLILFREKRGKIYGQGPRCLRGVMHVRGLGFIDVVSRFGKKAVAFEAPWRITLLL